MSVFDLVIKLYSFTIHWQVFSLNEGPKCQCLCDQESCQKSLYHMRSSNQQKMNKVKDGCGLFCIVVCSVYSHHSQPIVGDYDWKCQARYQRLFSLVKRRVYSPDILVGSADFTLEDLYIVAITQFFWRNLVKILYYKKKHRCNWSPCQERLHTIWITRGKW